MNNDKNYQQSPDAKDGVTESVRSVAGYNILSAIRTDDKTEIVMGGHTTSLGAEYATWQCSNGNNYYWGHYGFRTKEEALADMCERAAGEFRFQVSEKSNSSEEAFEEEDDEMGL